jgi:hypothetical protein
MQAPRFANWRRLGRSISAVSIAIAATACAPRERINASCEWKDTVEVLDGASLARRKHIEEDVRVAQDLGIRYGDSLAGRVWDDANRTARETCTNASFDSIIRQHGASPSEVDAAIGARIVWPDLFLVFIPWVLLLAAGSHAAVRTIASMFDTDDRLVPIIIFVVLTPVAAFIGVALGQIWSGFVEEIRMRSDHLSFRGAYLSIYVHRPLAVVVAVAIFGLIAARYRHHLGTGRRRRA